MSNSPTPPNKKPSVIGELPNYAECVTPDTSGKIIAQILEQHIKLPGVLILSINEDGCQCLMGMVSRQKCYEQLGRPFGVEVFLNRPIVALYQHLNISATVLPAEMSIETAVELALKRPSDQLYEPIVIQVGEAEFRLLDLHVLLLAETELLSNANMVIGQQYEEISSLNEELEAKVLERTKALQEAYNQLEQLDRTKADFISVASSELRSPLMVVNQYSQMLLLSSTIQMNSGLVRMINEMNAALKRLDDVVETMLDVARVDSKELSLNFQAVALDSIFNQLRKEYEKVLAARDLSFNIQYDNPLHFPEVRGDRDALYKVFNHLLQNAIKFTPNGGSILFRGRALQSNGNGVEGVEVIVKDSGVGVAPEQREAIFSKFYQTGKVSLHATGKLNFKGGGAGLGLAIVRGIIEAHGGRIWVESPGYDETTYPGSTFFVHLPAVEAMSASLAPATPNRAKTITV